MSRTLGILRKIGVIPAVKRPLEARFTEVFAERAWGSQESVSGQGSERASGQVTHSLAMLDRMIGELGVRSMSDLPCGDFNWMPSLLETHPELDYLGYDVVGPLIRQNRRNHPDRRFELLDITAQIPRQADLIFCKDLLNHLSNADVWAALANMVASKSRYLMITNNAGFENVELWDGVAGASRHLDLFAEPFRLPEAIYADHYMVLWDREAVARRLSEAGVRPR